MLRLRQALAILAVSIILVGLVWLDRGDLQAQAARGGKSTEQIAFIRNGDIWLMNPDGGSQRPWVANIGNAKGRLSWSPDNRRLVFSRQGDVTVKFPEGGGGVHRIYDLFYAYIDSVGKHDNFWLGFVETMGSQSPDWSRDGKQITFTMDRAGNVVNAALPDYTIAFYDTTTRKITQFDFPKTGRNLMGMMPTISPDGQRVCFVLGEYADNEIKTRGLVVSPVGKLSMTSDQLLQMATKVPDGSSPAWSPDGKLIAYLTGEALYVTPPDFSEKRMVCKADAGQWMTGMPCWSPKSNFLAFSTSNGSIYKVGADGAGKQQLSGPGADMNPAWTKPVD